MTENYDSPIFDALVAQEDYSTIPAILDSRPWSAADASARAFAAMREAGWAYGEDSVALLPPSKVVPIRKRATAKKTPTKRT